MHEVRVLVPHLIWLIRATTAEASLVLVKCIGIRAVEAVVELGQTFEAVDSLVDDVVQGASSLENLNLLLLHSAREGHFI